MIKYFVQICDVNGQVENIWSAKDAQILPRIGESYPVDRNGLEPSYKYKVFDVVHLNVANKDSKKGKLELFMSVPMVIIHRQKD